MSRSPPRITLPQPHLPPIPPGPSRLKKSKETKPKRKGHETQGKSGKTRQPNQQTQGNITMSGGSNRDKQYKQQQQGVGDTSVPNRKEPQPWIGLFHIVRPQHTNATDKTIPDNSRTPPTYRSAHLQDPQQPKRQEVSSEHNNHCKGWSVEANLPDKSRNSHPTITTFVAAVTYCPPTCVYPARRG